MLERDLRSMGGLYDEDSTEVGTSTTLARDGNWLHNPVGLQILLCILELQHLPLLHSDRLSDYCTSS